MILLNHAKLNTKNFYSSKTVRSVQKCQTACYSCSKSILINKNKIYYINTSLSFNKLKKYSNQHLKIAIKIKCIVRTCSAFRSKLIELHGIKHYLKNCRY